MDIHLNALQRLTDYQPVTLPETIPSAAVMVILLQDEANQLEIVLTKRAMTLPTYAGHYSFPGGIRDAEDANMHATAVREIQEELNLLPDTYQPIAQLDDFQDRNGHLVRPFVSLITKTTFVAKHKISPAEIDRLYYFPLTKLHSLKDNPKLHYITQRRPSYSYTEGDVFVWGLTAAILVHLRNILSAEHDPLGKEISIFHANK